jgi:hypothetical protein
MISKKKNILLCCTLSLYPCLSCTLSQSADEPTAQARGSQWLESRMTGCHPRSFFKPGLSSTRRRWLCLAHCSSPAAPETCSRGFALARVPPQQRSTLLGDTASTSHSHASVPSGVSPYPRTRCPHSTNLFVVYHCLKYCLFETVIHLTDPRRVPGGLLCWH